MSLNEFIDKFKDQYEELLIKKKEMLKGYLRAKAHNTKTSGNSNSRVFLKFNVVVYCK